MKVNKAQDFFLTRVGIFHTFSSLLLHRCDCLFMRCFVVIEKTITVIFSYKKYTALQMLYIGFGRGTFVSGNGSYLDLHLRILF